MADRQQQIDQFLASVAPYWEHIDREICARLDGLILQLVAEDNEQTRGRIKALQDFKDLPMALTHELSAIKAELSA